MENAINRLSADLLACDDLLDALFIGRMLRTAITEHIRHVALKGLEAGQATKKQAETAALHPGPYERA